ncbi:hypothetical protein CHUAL_010356 [Chamberlinius hualienensis]
MAAEDRWYFTKQYLADILLKRYGKEAEKELSYRQQAANLIQDMGQRLQVNQLCINTAIVYMHRFYVFHSFKKFNKNSIAACALFLAAKVEEQPRKLEHVIKIAHVCLHRDGPPLDIKSEGFLEQWQELSINENVMLQTLGFHVAIDHPHTHVVKCCQLVRGGNSSLHNHHVSKELAQTSYFMATNSLHLTTMCLQYKPTVVACVCIHLACKWGNWEIPKSSEGRRWFYYVDKTVTEELLEELTTEFLAILERSPSRLKRKATPNDMLEACSSDQNKAGCSSMPVTLSLPAASSSRHKLTNEKHHEQDRSSNRSSAKPLPPLSDEKNGAPGRPATDRIKKEHIGSSSLGTSVSTAPLTSVLVTSNELSMQSKASIQSVAGSSGKAELVKVANSLDNAQSSAANSDDAFHPAKKMRLDGGSRGMTPKEYHEYKERSNRDKEKMKQLAMAEQARMQAAKQGKSDDGWEKGIIQELTLKNTPLSSLNLQPVVSLTHLNLSELNQAKHSQLSAGSSTSRQFTKVDGLHTGSDDGSCSAQGFSRVAVNLRRSPENEVKDVSFISTRLVPSNESGALQPLKAPNAGFSMGPILTPSPPSTKDSDPFNMDDSIFTSPSDLLVPVALVENEPVQPMPVPLAATEQVKLEFSKGEHRKQRRDESKRNIKNSPSLVTSNEIKRSLNSSFTTSEHIKKEKVTSFSDVPESGLNSDQAPLRRHHSLKHSAEKSLKHRVKKSLPTVNDTISGGDESILPQQEFNILVPEHVNANLPNVSEKLLEVNADVRISSAAVSHLPTTQSETAQPLPTILSAPVVPEPVNDVKPNRNFHDQRHSIKSNSVLPALAENSIVSDKHVNETDIAMLPQIVKMEVEVKPSKRSSHSSSSSSKHKEKRKKHDKKDKSKDHKEKGEEKIPVMKLTIPKDTNAGTSKAENGSSNNATNHRPKDESLVVKIKLPPSTIGGKNSKNGNVAEVVPSSQSQSVSETLTVKERGGLKLKITKNQESYTIGNDEAKSKDRSRSSKESKRKSRSSSSPTARDASHSSASNVTHAKHKTVTIRSPKKVNNQTVTAALAVPSHVSQASNVDPVVESQKIFLRKSKSETSGQSQHHHHHQQLSTPSNQQLQQTSTAANNKSAEFNHRSGHDREQRGRGGKRGRGGMRMGGPLLQPVPPPPLSLAQQPPMMYQNMAMPMYDRSGGAPDSYAQFYNLGQNNFYNHQMYQEDNQMFFSQCGPHGPMMRHPQPMPMAFPQAPPHQPSRRGGGHHFIRQPVMPQRTNSGPPLPSMPPPANPPLPPDA